MIPFPDKKYDIIYADPPWSYSDKGCNGNAAEHYAALKRYEVIGPMASPFMNDPTAIVALAFRELYPGLEYYAQYVPGLEDEEGKPAYGLTIYHRLPGNEAGHL